MTLREMQTEAHRTAVEKGWYESDRPPLELLMLITTEVAEAAEEWRKPVEQFDKDALAEELADIVIRVGDAASHWEIDLEAAVAKKMARNRERPVRHGGKRF